MNLRFRQPRRPEDGGHPGLRPGSVVEDGLRVDRDVAVPLRDGSPIYIDVFRPEHAEAPLPMVIAWGPYGKHGGPAIGVSRIPAAGVDPAWGVSRHAAFEAPDPAYWCPRGYAIVNADPRGTWESPGDFTMGTRQEAEDFHDLIEWAGTRDWSNGRVGLAGASYLAWSQWRVAATRPPHLAAINPWEGLNDFYREWAYHGGIPEDRFLALMANRSTGFSRTRVEDFIALAAEHPLLDEYWQGKAADLSAVDVPTYVVAGWASHELHTRGTLEAYKQIAGERTWLEVHGRKIWSHYYRPESVERQREFFDWALKGERNGWPARPRVLLEVRDGCGAGETRAEREWPPARTRFVPLHLDAGTGELATQPPASEAEIGYPAAGSEGAAFERVFDKDTEITGHMKLRLWVEVDESDDADLFVAAQKVDRAGELVGFPFVGIRDDGPVALGWLRASHRELDPVRSTPEQPWHPHTSEQRLEPGVSVAVEIELWPSSTRFAAGERLRLVVQGTDVYPGGEFGHTVTRNAGRHVIRTGGRYDSHLLVPVIPGSRLA